MRNGSDYYSVLGVSRDAGPEELKRRFRTLARQLHPDVADDPEAAQQHFIAVVDAYRTLSDPVRRRAYDAVQAGAPAPVATRSVQRQRQIDDWFRHAVHNLEAGDLNGAAAQCRKILAIDTQHAAALALLGDVASQRQDWDQAILHFSGAVSAAPRNAVYARKLRAALEGGQQARAVEERRRLHQAQRQRALDALNARHEYAPYAVLLAFAWLLTMLAWAVRTPGDEMVGWFPLPCNLALASAGGGLLLGVILACSGWFSGESRGPGWVTVSLGVLSCGLFYLSAAFYCLWSMLRARLVPSLTVAYVATIGLVAALAAAAHHGGGDGAGRNVALLAGNLVFPCLLLGHKLARVGLRAAA